MKRKNIEIEIRNTVKRIMKNSEAWDEFVSNANECAITDRILEDIIEDAKKLEKLQEELFKNISNK